jgi:hypothetical protein
MAHMARTLSKEEIFELSAEARLHLIESGNLTMIAKLRR